ncbi:Pycsar system effector family protein [Deminuibacter soli]|uniref:Pycsar effector protein domain-containing protein n=1 Tax=Deminuibacter soli TaxID=2291815 RepID=A0A3E1NHA7_9BACT|nr:Pycsar system effector family protein [Deminuibacter soli]RFM27346.1 hypothetical protein DXN05_15075 [Deminuibacter soli]
MTKKKRPEPPTDFVFRFIAGNAQRLSKMSDKKAHILITVNAIILSGALSLVIKKLEDESTLIIPAFILLAVNLLSVMLAVLATRPSLSKRVLPKNKFGYREVNLMFFGSFYKLMPHEYTAGIRELAGDEEKLMHAMTRDGFFLARALGKKYLLLRYAYSVFMVGLIVSIVAFAVVLAVIA